MRRRSVTLLLSVLLAGCDTGESLQRMNHQARGEAYSESTLFADGATMRTPPAGTVARGTVLGDPAFITSGVYSRRIPVPVTREMLGSGRERFAVYCAACHGLLGDSRTVVADHMKLRPPPSLQEKRGLAPGRVYDVIARGYGLMPSYAAQLSIEERWAVVAYVRALELSQAVALDDLPAAIRSEALTSLPTRDGDR